MKISVAVAVAVLCLVALAASDAPNEGKNYVLLIAGSNTYGNYRHQANVCHAYHIFHDNGIPDEQIVVMMYDDIAYNEENPFKGNIINRENGPNLYPGVPKDYTKDHVNAEVFLAVLQGDKDKVKKLTGKTDVKVIDSTSNDNIFVYYTDHGAKSLVGMPTGDLLRAAALNQALRDMHQKKKFAKMVFYLEACESGSMLDGLLPKDINVYAVTSTNDVESGWACCYDDKRQTFLSDVFSTNWMGDTDKAPIHTETFETQFHNIVKHSNRSHPQQFGDLKYSNFTLDKFFVGKSVTKKTKPIEKQGSTSTSTTATAQPEDDAVRSEFVPLAILRHKINSAEDGSPLRRDLEIELEKMEATHAQTYELFWAIAQEVNGGVPQGDAYKKIFTRGHGINDMDCYYDAVDALTKACPKVNTNINSLFLRNFYVLANLCNHNVPAKVLSAVQSMAFNSPLCS